MCRMLLSIRPQYVEEIINGTKKYEYRKVRCREKVDRILIYATAPISQVVAEVVVLGIMEDSPRKVWNETKDFSGISMSFFYEYFRGRETAVAYHLGEVEEFPEPKLLEDFGIMNAPQSFMYIT